MRKLLVAGFLLTALMVTAPTAAAAPPLPASIAAIGDSITRATDVCCFYGQHPARSWSTGDVAGDVITSHYEHLVALDPAITGHAYNDARNGAKMREALGQALSAVSQRANYVTFMLGGSDVCARTASEMTSVDTFRNQFITAMAALAVGLPPNSHVFVASIPNIYLLWQDLHNNPLAQIVWSGARLCQSMLSPFNTESDRLAVLAREVQLNQVLASVCGLFAFCRFDGNAVFNFQFSANDISSLDFFHPSLTGQAALASITWSASWWGGP
jgi:lysophospholipase L1-like esterase